MEDKGLGYRPTFEEKPMARVGNVDIGAKEGMMLKVTCNLSGRRRASSLVHETGYTTHRVTTC